MVSKKIEWESTLPNKITFARIVAAVPIVMFYNFGYSKIAVAVFIVACASDFFDGWIARLTKSQSDWGHLADPVADKICCAAAIVVGFGEFGHMSAFTIPIIFILVYDGLVVWMRTRVDYMRTNQAARAKTCSLMVGLMSQMTLVATSDVLFANFDMKFLVGTFLTGLMVVSLWTAAVLACVSAWVYAKENLLAGAPQAAE